MTRKEILEAAEKCVCGDREQDYGSPERSFGVIGQFWETYLQEKCLEPRCGGPSEVQILPEDVAAMMCLSRLPVSPRVTARQITGSIWWVMELAAESWRKKGEAIRIPHPAAGDPAEAGPGGGAGDPAAHA